MKKYMLIIAIVLVVMPRLQAENTHIDPIYQARTLNAFTISAGSTVSVNTSSMTVNGTNYEFALSSTNLVNEMASAVGATMVQGAYLDNESINLSVFATTYLESATTFTVDITSGISYILPAVENKYNVLDNLLVNATFASGTTVVNIYDGSATTTQLRKETITASAVDGVLDLRPYGSNLGFYASKGNAMRIDVVGSIAVTAGYMNILGRKIYRVD